MKAFRRPEDLCGEELSAVCFVRDYVELHFDGPVIRAFSTLTVLIQGSTFTSDVSSDWRDRLCGFIGLIVQAVDIDENHSITLTFRDAWSLVISLRVSEGATPEAAHFVPFPGSSLMIW